MISDPDDYRICERKYVDGHAEYFVQENKYIGNGKYWTDISVPLNTKEQAVKEMEAIIVISERIL